MKKDVFDDFIGSDEDVVAVQSHFFEERRNKGEISRAEDGEKTILYGGLFDHDP